MLRLVPIFFLNKNLNFISYEIIFIVLSKSSLIHISYELIAKQRETHYFKDLIIIISVFLHYINQIQFKLNYRVFTALPY
jgi:hypothetical protein